MSDPFGESISDYFKKGKAPYLIVDSNYTHGEKIAPSWFFRTEEEMPLIERSALNKCVGKVLDIGAAAGCHALVLQEKGFEVIALEKSEKAAEVMVQRGIAKVVCTDIMDFTEGYYDTILLLMNGAGIGKTLTGLEKLLNHLKKLLAPNGMILLDSTDIKYLFQENDGSIWIDLARNTYYGEMEYEVRYKKSAIKFNWLFVDFKNLKRIAAKCQMECILLKKGDHFDYLAQLKVKSI